MRELKTTVCRQKNHAEITLHVADEASIDPTWLISFFEDAVLKGTCFRAGETVQIGWMMVTLKANAQGDLEVWEPGFDSMPIRWVLGINNTLRHLILQKSVSELIGREPDFPSLLKAGVATAEFLRASNNLMMSREEPLNNNSGWFFGVTGEPQNQGQLKSLYEISLSRMEIIPYLSLPKGTRVSKTENEIQIEFGGRGISSQDNDFLRRLLNSPILV